MKEVPDAKFDWCEYIGKRICFEQNKSGILRYYGKIKFGDGFWFGIELDEATGETDGSFNGVKYFTCEDQHGIFIPESSTINIVALTQVCNEENVPLNRFEFEKCEDCVDEKTFNPFHTNKIGFNSTEKENLSLNTYFSNHLMVPKKLPCILSPLKEESGNYIDISDLNSTTVLKCSCGDDQESLMKTFTLKDSTFNVVNDEKVKDINLIYTVKNDSNLTDTDDSLGILPALLNDSPPSWDDLTANAKICNENFSDLTDSLSLKNTCPQTEKGDLACMASYTVAFHTSDVKEGSVTFPGVDSPVLDCENLPVCASTPKHEIIFTNFCRKSPGLDIPKSCSALAVSGDSTLGHKEQIFNFLDVSTVDDFDVTFVQPHSERPCLSTSYDVSKKCSKDKLFKPCQGENPAIAPSDIKDMHVENILKSTLDSSTNFLNSTFVHQNNVDNSDFVCKANNGSDTEHNLNDVVIANNLNKTFRMNEEKVTKLKRSSTTIKSDLLNTSEFQKINLQCTFTAKHFDCIKESLSNDSQKKKDIKMKSKLSNPENLSNTIKKTTNLPILNKDRFSSKCSQTRKSSSSESCRNKTFITKRQSLSSVSDLKRSVGHSLADKNQTKCRRNSLSRVENKSYSLLNSTIIIPKSINKNLHSEERPKNCLSIDSVKLFNSIGSEKSTVTSDLNSLHEPNEMDISVFLSEEPVIMKPSGENVTVGHITPTKPFHGEKDSITISAEIENKNVHCVPNFKTCSEMDVGRTDNCAAVNISEPLVTDVAANTVDCLELNVPILTGGNEECVENVLNESIVCTDNTCASTNQLKQSLDALNSLTVTKKGSYKEFANTLNTQNLKTDLSTTLCSTSTSEDLSKLIVKKSNASTFSFTKTTDKTSSMNTQNLNINLSTTFCSTSRSENLSKSIVKKSKSDAVGYAKTANKASSVKNKMPKLFGLESHSETSKVKISVRQSTGSVSDSTHCSLGSNLKIINAKTSSNLRKHSFNQKDIVLLQNSSGIKSNFVKDSAKVKTSILPSKSVVKAGTSNCVTDSTKGQKVFLTSKKVVETETSNCVTDSTKGSKTILPSKKVMEAGTSNCVTDSAKDQKVFLTSKKVMEAGTSNCVADSTKGPKTILPSKKVVEAGTSIYVSNSAKCKRTSILPSTRVLEAGTSKYITVTKTIKYSQQQNLSSALKKESCVVKTSIKCPAVKLTLVDSSKPKPNSINGACKVNSEKHKSSKLSSSKNNSGIMPVKNYLRPSVQPSSSSIRSEVFNREDLNAPAPSKSNVQRKSAESSGLAVSNIPKQGLGIPKLFNRASTGCEKNAGNVIRRLKSPCQVKKKT